MILGIRESKSCGNLDLTTHEGLGKIRYFLPPPGAVPLMPIPVIPATHSGAFRPPGPIHSGKRGQSMNLGISLLFWIEMR
jgi:hypothetical protein